MNGNDVLYAVQLKGILQNATAQILPAAEYHFGYKPFFPLYILLRDAVKGCHDIKQNDSLQNGTEKNWASSLLFLLKSLHAEFHSADCHYAESHSDYYNSAII
jgi:hypothetical protein